MKENQGNIWLLIVSLILFALAFYFYNEDTSPAKESEIETPQVPIASTPEAQPQTISPTPAKINVVKKATKKPNPLKKRDPMKNFSPLKKEKKAGGPAYKLPNGTVGFKVVKGKAIAFGDIVLGNTSPQFEGKIGAAKLPRPQTWYLPIPFAIDPKLPDGQKTDIQDSLIYLVEAVGLEFVEYDGSQEDVLYFTDNDKHCYSYLGMIGGTQPIYLSPGCGPQAILHEMLHALGFVHEQNRGDRDSFLQIFWQNIQTDYHIQFMKVPEDLMENYGASEFDYQSIMLYEDHFFANKRGKKTMKSKTQRQIRPIQKGLSTRDIERIQNLYGL